MLLGRFELPASPLPRECSTPELQQPLKKAGRRAMVLLGRFELPASPLPRECSTPELQQHRALAVRAGYRPLAGNWSSPNYAKIFDLGRMVQFCWSRLHSASEYSIKAGPLEPETYWQDDSTAKQAISRDQRRTQKARSRSAACQSGAPKAAATFAQDGGSEYQGGRTGQRFGRFGQGLVRFPTVSKPHFKKNTKLAPSPASPG